VALSLRKLCQQRVSKIPALAVIDGAAVANRASRSAVSGLIRRLKATMPAAPKPQPPLDSDSNCAKTRRILQ
jgi:hypothetical protein